MNAHGCPLRSAYLPRFAAAALSVGLPIEVTARPHLWFALRSTPSGRVDALAALGAWLPQAACQLLRRHALDVTFTLGAVAHSRRVGASSALARSAARGGPLACQLARPSRDAAAPWFHLFVG
eukprot:5884483-Alexandrium_andersonii.AAC.2